MNRRLSIVDFRLGGPFNRQTKIDDRKFLSPSTCHLPPEFLMCRPTYYTIAYEINPWMSLKRQANPSKAMRQWQALYDLLTKTLGLRVRLLSPKPGVPDLIFTANAGLMHGCWFILSHFRHPQRQREVPVIERYARRMGWRIKRLPRNFHFEGEGDALWMGQTLVFGFRFRSDAPVHERLSRLLGVSVLPLELVDRRFYHLDTCFCPLSSTSALWFPKAFDRYGRKVIERLVSDLIPVSEADAIRFACNAIVVGRAVVLQQGISRSLQRALTHRGLELYPLDLTEFLKAGGSAKCLALRLE